MNGTEYWWNHIYKHRCILYPTRDCPGCLWQCERVGDCLGTLPVIDDPEEHDGTRARV